MEPRATPEFSLWKVVLPVLGGLLSVSLLVNWYSREVSIPRYCSDPAGHLALVEKIISRPRPAGDEARRAYVVAAKLLFLVPRQSAEPADTYLTRLEAYLRTHCH